MGRGGLLDAARHASVLVTFLAVALVWSTLQDRPKGLDEGLAALRDGRYEEAERLLTESLAPEGVYEGWVALGIARGRLGKLPEARVAFDRAIALDAHRPEARVERGGLSFIEGRYEDAADDLALALTRKEDAYTRDLLASSLHLLGRADAALGYWNAMGRPLLRRIEIHGLAHTRDRVVRREITPAEGALLTRDDLRKTRLRLSELHVLDRVTIRPVPLGDGQADLDVAVAERHGFYRSHVDMGVSIGMNALSERFSLRYSNVLGEGMSVGGQYRWQRNRPDLLAFLEWPRPLGLPAHLSIQAFRGRQEYDLAGERIGRRSRGIDVSFRRVLGARTVGQVGFRTRHRSFSRMRVDAVAGTVAGLEAVIERNVVETPRHRLDVSLRAFSARPELGSDVTFLKGLAKASYRLGLRPTEGTAIEPSVLAMQFQWGRGGGRTPLDEMFAPGGSPDMELPLRAHRQVRRGILGTVPLGRSLGLGNLEVRQRVMKKTVVSLGVVAFYDVAWIGGTAAGASRALHDVGVGVRVAFPSASTLRVDFGHSLSDGRQALFVGLNQVF